jgi:adenosine deaminase
MPSTLLLCTLGMTWSVIPEVFAFLAPAQLPLYEHHPEWPSLQALREEHRLRAPEEIWVMTTATTRDLHYLEDWARQLPHPIPIRVWKASECGDLMTQRECEHYRELVFRAALHAREQVGPNGHVYMSLAGGRKTMSADLQYAAQIMGCEALLHVVAPEYGQLPEVLRGQDPSAFCRPLSPADAQAISLIFNGVHRRSPLLDVALPEQQQGQIRAQDFPLHLGDPPDGKGRPWVRPDSAWLWKAIEERQAEGQHLLENYLSGIQRQDLHNNWHGLYRLPPAEIEHLRSTRIDAPDPIQVQAYQRLLTALPKADLHAHMGGYLDIAAQKQVGAALWAALSPDERAAAAQAMAPLLRQAEQGYPWPKHLKQATQQGLRPANAACLLHQLSEAQLTQQLFPSDLPRVALSEKSGGPGFAHYEYPGDLSGSALLAHPAALRPYARAIRQQMEQQGLCYLELRGSPTKYWLHNPLGFIRAWEQALIAEGISTRMTEPEADSTSLAEQRHVRMIVIADRRHTPAEIAATVQVAVDAHRDGFVVGLDLAGDESQGDIQRIAEAFAPAFEACLAVTIHAGEGVAAENIWKAAYLLHAERIGHGLTRADNEALANKFRDRGICLELCPTSNIEVVGYAHPTLAPAQPPLPQYPLAKLWKDRGLYVTLCTDNPGISRTDLVQEYFRAAAMMPSDQPLTLWDTLALVRRSFVHSFLPHAERSQLVKAVDVKILALMRDFYAQGGVRPA